MANASDAIVEDIRELHRLETEKRSVPISTERFHALAEEVTQKSRDIMRTAAIEETLGNQTETGDVTIDDVRRADNASGHRRAS